MFPRAMLNSPHSYHATVTVVKVVSGGTQVGPVSVQSSGRSWELLGISWGYTLYRNIPKKTNRLKNHHAINGSINYFDWAIFEFANCECHYRSVFTQELLDVYHLGRRHHTLDSTHEIHHRSCFSLLQKNSVPSTMNPSIGE
jgi:hypothetical protein